MSADLVLTDPPYGLDWNYDLHNDTEIGLAELIKIVMPQIQIVGKRTLLTCGHTNMWKYPEPDWVLCWQIPAGANRNKWGFTTWQPILAYGKDPYLANGMGARADSFSITETAEKNGHPCPKPIGVWEKVLLRGSVKTTDTILDPFAGSGTTLVAAKRLGRKAIGIEISEKYCRIAIDRLRQRELF
jgi:site-specific DNA-methyltransferase (adenine-specific)